MFIGHGQAHVFLRKHAQAYQGVKHKDVVVVSLRVLHHNVKQGVQSVLQKLYR